MLNLEELNKINNFGEVIIMNENIEIEKIRKEFLGLSEDKWISCVDLDYMYEKKYNKKIINDRKYIDIWYKMNKENIIEWKYGNRAGGFYRIVRKRSEEEIKIDNEILLKEKCIREEWEKEDEKNNKDKLEDSLNDGINGFY